MSWSHVYHPNPYDNSAQYVHDALNAGGMEPEACDRRSYHLDLRFASQIEAHAALQHLREFTGISQEEPKQIFSCDGDTVTTNLLTEKHFIPGDYSKWRYTHSIPFLRHALARLGQRLPADGHDNILAVEGGDPWLPVPLPNGECPHDLASDMNHWFSQVAPRDQLAKWDHSLARVNDVLYYPLSGSTFSVKVRVDTAIFATDAVAVNEDGSLWFNLRIVHGIHSAHADLVGAEHNLVD